MRAFWVILALLFLFIFKDFIFQDSIPVLAPKSEAVAEQLRQDPVQKSLRNSSEIYLPEGVVMPRASYEITARVLGKKYYSPGGMYREAAKAMLMDIGLAWGKSAEPEVVDSIWLVRFTKFGDGSYGRYIQVGLSSNRMAMQEFYRYVSNNHIIAASKEIRKKLGRLKPGQIVTLKGYLVDFQTKSGMRFTTSISREDQASGACEILYVEDVIVHDAVEY
jgi:hypothetical protein